MAGSDVAQRRGYINEFPAASGSGYSTAADTAAATKELEGAALSAPNIWDATERIPPRFGVATGLWPVSDSTSHSDVATKKKMPDVDLAIRHPAFSRCVQQILNCALLVVSLSLGFFRFQGLNGISEPRIASGSVLAVDLFNHCFEEQALQRVTNSP